MRTRLADRSDSVEATQLNLQSLSNSKFSPVLVIERLDQLRYLIWLNLIVSLDSTLFAEFKRFLSIY